MEVVFGVALAMKLAEAPKLESIPVPDEDEPSSYQSRYRGQVVAVWKHPKSSNVNWHQEIDAEIGKRLQTRVERVHERPNWALFLYYGSKHTQYVESLRMSWKGSLERDIARIEMFHPTPDYRRYEEDVFRPYLPPTVMHEFSVVDDDGSLNFSNAWSSERNVAYVMSYWKTGQSIVRSHYDVHFMVRPAHFRPQGRGVRGIYTLATSTIALFPLAFIRDEYGRYFEHEVANVLVHETAHHLEQVDGLLEEDHGPIFVKALEQTAQLIGLRHSLGTPSEAIDAQMAPVRKHGIRLGHENPLFLNMMAQYKVL